MQPAAGCQPADQQVDEGGLDQAALVVALLVPGIGEVDVHAGQRARRHHLLQHLDRVVAQQAQVVQAPLADLAQQRAHAGLMHLDADEVEVGPRQRDLRRGLAHAEADLQHPRRGATEQGVPVGHGRLERQQVTRPQVLQGALLAAAQAAGAQYETAHGSLAQRRAGVDRRDNGIGGAGQGV